MARPSDLTDKQFIRLCHKLQINPREGIGLLEYGWLLANISGEPHYTDADDLAALLHWTKDPKKLAAAMLETGYLTKTKNGGLAIADFEEKRLQDWAKKRRERAAERQTSAAERQTTGPRRRPTRSDSDSGSPKKQVIPFDPDHLRQRNRDRQEPANQDTRRASKNPQGGALGALQGAIAAKMGLDQPPGHPKAPKATQPIGTYSPRDCGLAAASLDKNLEPQQAQAMWITRAAEVCSYPGGLSFFQDLLAKIHNAKIPGNPKGEAPIHSPGAWLNKQTREFVERRRPAC